MKIFLSTLFLLLYSVSFTFSQDGLKGIIVEKYYISSKEDSKSPEFSGGLEKGSITYRIYVDLKPGYTFQVAYGSPDHELLFKSKKPFYNHVEHGSECPDKIPLRTYKKNICRLDSWLSVGAAGENQLGVLKSDDDTLQVFPLDGNFLKNKDKDLGRPLTEVDGMVDRTDLTFPTFFQLDEALKALGSSTNTNFIRIYNGAWAAMGKGMQGLDSLHNRVLIAQLTTKGKLTYKLNLLIGRPDGSSEKYVAKYPKEGEFTHPELTNVK